MPHYKFFVKQSDVRTTESDAEGSELLNSGYQKLDFEADAADKKGALKKLQVHLGENTTAVKNFSGDITLSSIIESLLR